MSLKIDLHVHTVHSHDSSITPRELALYARKQRIDGVAIVDHDKLSRLKDYEELGDLLVIPGAEITTHQGHVLALNISTIVEPGLSFAETVDQIHDADGLAIVAHPTAFFKRIAERQIDQLFDAIEVINSSAVPFSLSVLRNVKTASDLGIPQTGGSDAHHAPEIGWAYTLTDAEASVDDVVKAVEKGAVTPRGGPMPKGLRFKRGFLSLKKRLIGKF